MTLGSFNEDYDALASLVQRSWAENRDVSIKYTPEFLRSCFEYPGASVELAPTIYENGRPTAFIAGFPRNVIWNSRPQALILSTLLTSSPETKGRGYGAWLWMELARRTRAAGYDGMISICIEGGPVNGIVQECSRRLGFLTARVYEVRYRSMLLTKGNGGDGATQAGADLFVDLAAQSGAHLGLRRVWTKAEADWQCRLRSGAISVEYAENGSRGVITGYVADVVGPAERRVLNIEDLLWNELDVDRRVHLLRALLDKAVEQGAHLASVPLTGQTDYEPLKQIRFRSLGRQMNVYLTRWEAPAPAPVDSMYLDVF